ncbi:MAG: hypothetical protein JWO85_1348, partial [Candidatus Eremiobacteraeota bacterium]|nr:hypothetical protein [Candidatus Eremiobacteraeota bacterium]
MFFNTATRRAAVLFLTLIAPSGCGGAGSSQALPTSASAPASQTVPNAASAQAGSLTAPAATTTPAPAATPFTVTGRVKKTTANGFLMQSDLGCGNLNVVSSSSTTMLTNGLTLAGGVYARVWGSGSCATQITATAVSLASSASGPFPAPSGSPAPAPSGSPAPTSAPASATPRPTATPIATATPVATVPPSSGNVAMFHGCPVFAAGDYYNAPVTNAAVDPNTTNYINSVWSNGGTSGFYAATGNLGVNLANNSTPLLPVHPTGGYAFPVPYPWSPNFYIQPPSDHHAMVVQTQTCHEYESWSTSYNSSTNTLSAYMGANWDLTKPYAVLPPGAYSGMASGLSLFAGLVRWEDYQSGAINHALNFSGTYGSVTQHKYVSPASSTDPNGSTPAAYDLPYGAHLRLKASFSTAGWGPQATMVANALKTYGMYLADA